MVQRRCSWGEEVIFRFFGAANWKSQLRCEERDGDSPGTKGNGCCLGFVLSRFIANENVSGGHRKGGDAVDKQNRFYFGRLDGLIFLIATILFQISFSQDVYWDSIYNEAHYFFALDSVDEATFQKEFEYPFLLLLTEEQIAYYRSLQTLGEQKAFIELFWKVWNPNPLLPENDRLADFIRRCAYAEKYFSSSEPPYLDDRGKYYIKYGKPTNLYRDMGGSRNVRFFKNPEIYQYMSRLYNGFPPSVYYQVLPNESWIYRNLGQDFIIYFVKEGTTFKETSSLTKVLSTSIMKNVSWYWSDLIHDRAQLSPSLARAANAVLQIENELMVAAYSGLAVGIDKGNIFVPQERILQLRNTHEMDVVMSRRDAPIATYNPVHADNNLEFVYDIAQFRGSPDSTRVEVFFVSPIKKNILSGSSFAEEDTLRVEFQCLLRDSKKYNPILQVKNRSAFLTEYFELADFPNVVSNLDFLACPQEGDLTLQIKEMKRANIGFLKRPFQIRDFRGNALMISDVQFFTEILDSNQMKIFPMIKKQETVLSPYPYDEIHKSVPVFCYFEIYNLQLSGIVDKYEIALKVSTDKSRAGTFKKITKWMSGTQDHSISLVHMRQVTSNNSEELLSIDFGNLTNGPYRFEIIVTDTMNETVATKIQKDITVAD